MSTTYVTPASPWPPARLFCLGRRETFWNHVDFPAWCVTSVDQPTIFAPFSCSINWFLIFYALCVALALDMVQDIEIFLIQRKGNC